ncbi:hypothetical protein ABS71_14100 [bacterium SCN 62-11]|nr:hypothetical protein [Candidatus Eremiobacteraeota bacterium]ODT63607.1 MAG: hypothetical protein ABS71_14100 [bacterium SCN 62-11]
MDQFLAELKLSGDRSHFAVDWARAREKMGAHLDLEAVDYACHFAQLAYHLGSSQIQLGLSGDWLEWSCDGRLLEESKMQATAAGELLMADLDLCLNFCLQSVLLSPYSERIFSSGGWQLHGDGKSWKLRSSQIPGTRLRLRLPWKHRLRKFMISAWWTKLPELERLYPRMPASPLCLRTPQPLPQPTVLLEIRGNQAIGSAENAIRLDYPELNGSCWLDFQGDECQILSQGLAYASQPFLPGRLWLCLGDQPTDLGRRQLVLGADFGLARSLWLRQLSLHFGAWLEDPRLLEAGVREWLLACMVSLADLEGGEFRDAFWELPLLPTLYDGYLSLWELHQRVGEEGCPVISRPVSEELGDRPFMLVAEDPRLLAFLRLRYEAVFRSGEEQIERLRRWRTGPRINLGPLQLYSHNWPIEAGDWKGGVAFDPSGTMTRLDLYRQGRLMAEMGPARGLVPGFWIIADHPELDKPDKELADWIQKHQIVWLAQVFAQTEKADRFELMERVLATEGLNLGPLLRVELWEAPGLTLEGWLADGQRQDLRRWVDADISMTESMRFMLAKKFGHGSADEALARAFRYAQQLALWRDRPQAVMRLPEPAQVEVSAPLSLDLGLGEGSDIRMRLYRCGRLLVEHQLEKWAGLPDGLLVAADHDGFRLALQDYPQIDPECEGYRSLFPAIQQLLKPLLAKALQQKIKTALAAVESVSRRHWPGDAPLLERLDGNPVTLDEARTAENPSVLVGPAARVPLPGFEDCWVLNSHERSWLERVFERTLADVTRAYNDAYRTGCYEQSRGTELAALPPWREPGEFHCGSLRARAGLVATAAPAHLCETTFCRGGRAVMRCSLKLSEGRGRDAEEQLICQVDWEEIPFVENYRQLLAQPEVVELIEWLRNYSFQPPFPLCDFQLARLQGDAGLDEAAVFPRYDGRLLSRSQLVGEVLYGTEPSGPDEALCLSAATLGRLQELLPEGSLRHHLVPSLDTRIKRALLLNPARALMLPDGGYALRGQAQDWVWGLADRLTAPATVGVLMQGRPAGKIHPDWPLEIYAEILVQDLILSPEGKILPEGEVKIGLDSLYAEIQSRVLEELARPARLRLGLMWLQSGQIPRWARCLRDLDALEEWWEQPEPRPYVFSESPFPGAIQLPPAVVGWAELQGLQLRNCTLLADQLARAPICHPPEAEFELSGDGWSLLASRRMMQTTVRELYGRRLLKEQIHRGFPPYYLERQTDQSGPPVRAYEELYGWWSEQLAEADWLPAMEELLETAEPHADWLLTRARARLRQLQEEQQDPWLLLRRGLELICAEPLRLALVEHGPLLEVRKDTARLNQRLAGNPDKPRIAALLSLAAHDLVTVRSVPQVLSSISPAQMSRE